MVELEELQMLADDRNDKYLVFLKVWRDLLLAHINYIVETFGGEYEPPTKA